MIWLYVIVPVLGLAFLGLCLHRFGPRSCSFRRKLFAFAAVFAQTYGLVCLGYGLQTTFEYHAYRHFGAPTASLQTLLETAAQASLQSLSIIGIVSILTLIPVVVVRRIWSQIVLSALTFAISQSFADWVVSGFHWLNPTPTWIPYVANALGAPVVAIAATALFHALTRANGRAVAFRKLRRPVLAGCVLAAAYVTFLHRIPTGFNFSFTAPAQLELHTFSPSPWFLDGANVTGLKLRGEDGLNISAGPSLSDDKELVVRAAESSIDEEFFHKEPIWEYMGRFSTSFQLVGEKSMGVDVGRKEAVRVLSLSMFRTFDLWIGPSPTFGDSERGPAYEIVAAFSEPNQVTVLPTSGTSLDVRVNSYALEWLSTERPILELLLARFRSRERAPIEIRTNDKVDFAKAAMSVILRIEPATPASPLAGSFSFDRVTRMRFLSQRWWLFPPSNKPAGYVRKAKVVVGESATVRWGFSESRELRKGDVVEVIAASSPLPLQADSAESVTLTGNYETFIINGERAHNTLWHSFGEYTRVGIAGGLITVLLTWISSRWKTWKTTKGKRWPSLRGWLSSRSD